MADYIHVSIIGLSLAVSNQIKSLIQDAYHQYEMRWTNIADPELDVIIVSDAFIDSPAIRRHSEKNRPILAVQSKAQHHNVIIEDTLFLPFERIDALKSWLDTHIQQQSHTHSITPQKITESIDLVDLLAPIWSHTAKAFYVLQLNEDHFLIDTRKQEIWVNHDFVPQHIQHISLQAIDFDRAVQLRQKKQRFDLRYWLWNHLWQHIPSSQLTLSHISTAKLHHWPQPNLNTPKDTLKMAACFEHGAQLQDVLTYTQLSEHDVRIFVTLGLACNLLNAISTKEIHFQQNQHNDAKGSVLRSFFSKMRKRLGL